MPLVPGGLHKSLCLTLCRDVECGKYGTCMCRRGQDKCHPCPSSEWVGDELRDGPFLRLQERFTWRQEHISLPPKKRRLSPRGGGRLPAGVEAELAEGGQAGPAGPCLCLGTAKFEGLFRPSSAFQNSRERESNTSGTIYWAPASCRRLYWLFYEHQH